MFYILLTWLSTPLWAALACWRRWRYPAPQRILLTEIAGIGDVVCSSAVFRALRAQYPKANIALLVESFSHDIAASDPNLDQVYSITAGKLRGMGGRLTLARLMRRYDTVICLNPGAAQLCAMCWSGTPRRLSVLPPAPKRSYRWLRPLLTATHSHQDHAVFVQSQLNLLRHLGVESRDCRKQLHITPAIQAHVDQMLGTGCHVGIAIGSGLAMKEIPEALLLVSIRFLQQHPGITTVLIGGPKEQSKARTLLAALGQTDGILDLTGKLALTESAALLSRLALFIGVNSGVTHMADALGTAIICLSGPSDVVEQGPNGPRVTILRQEPPCCPCDAVFSTPDRCRIGTRECIAEVPPVLLIAAIQQALTPEQERSDLRP